MTATSLPHTNALPPVLHELDDQTLLERFTRTGDAQAFAVIVHRYTDLVYGTAIRVVRNKAMAEDTTQETFFRLLRNPESIESSLAGWLHRAATTHAIDLMRRESRRRNRELQHVKDERDLVPPEVENWAEMSPHVDAALAELPDEQRWVLVQHYLMGKTMRELAKDRNSSAATMSRRHQQALETLREKLRKRGVLLAMAALPMILSTAPKASAAPSLKLGLAKMTMLGGAMAPQVPPVFPGDPGAGVAADPGFAATLAERLQRMLAVGEALAAPILIFVVLLACAAALIAIGVNVPQVASAQNEDPPVKWIAYEPPA